MQQMITGYDHVQVAIPAGSEDEARAFYGGLLGMTEVPKPAALAGRGGCWFTSGAAVLHLGAESPFAPARKAHPAFVVAGPGVPPSGRRGTPARASADGTAAPSAYTALRARLVDAGHECVDSSGEIEGVVRFHTHDPFGNRLEFQQS